MNSKKQNTLRNSRHLYKLITVTDNQYIMVTAFYPWNVYEEHFRFLSHDLYLCIKIIFSSYFVLLLGSGKPGVQLVQSASLAMPVPEGILGGRWQKNPRAHTIEALRHTLWGGDKPFWHWQVQQSWTSSVWKGPPDILWSNSSLFHQGHLEPFAQDHVQVALEYLQRWRLHNLSGWPMQTLSSSQ